MANEKTVVEELEFRDLEDDSKLKVAVLACTELGNNSKPGLQVMWMGNIVNFHPLAAEKWAYEAKKKGGDPLLLEDQSWVPHQNQFIKIYFVPGSPAKARVEMKTRSMDQSSTKDFDCPFNA